MHTKHPPALFTGETNQWNCIGTSETEVVKEVIQPQRAQTVCYIFHTTTCIWFIFILCMFSVNLDFAIHSFLIFAPSSLNSTDPQHYLPSSTISPAPASYSAVYSQCRSSSCPSKSAPLQKITYTAQSPVASANSSCGSRLM